MAVDAAGNIVIADEFNNRVRVVAVATGTSYGRAMTAGDIYTLAGSGNDGYFGDGGPDRRPGWHSATTSCPSRWPPMAQRS